jgi:hypothetical protein
MAHSAVRFSKYNAKAYLQKQALEINCMAGNISSIYHPFLVPITMVIQTCFRSLAPAHSTGAKCFDMLKPNSEANQRIVVTAMGTSSNSVWWRNGSAL